MSDGFTVDISDFEECLRTYAIGTQKDTAEVCNRAGRNVSIKTHKRLPAGKPGKVSADLNTVFTYWGTATKAKASRKWSNQYGSGETPGVEAGQRVRTHRTARISQAKRKYILVAARARKKGLTLTGPQMGGKVTALQRARSKSTNYLRLVAMMSGQPFGAFPNAKVKKGLASASESKKAKTAVNAQAVVHMVYPEGADPIIVSAVQGALDEVGTDMMNHALGLMAKRARAASGK